MASIRNKPLGPGQRHELGGFPGVDGEGLLAEDMLACGQGGQGDFVMMGVRSGDVHDVDGVVGQQPFIAGLAGVVAVGPGKAIVGGKGIRGRLGA